MSVRGILSKVALVAGLSLLLAAPSFGQQWPYQQQQLPQSSYPYSQGDVNGYSSRITQQPVVQYADGNSAILTWRTDSNFNTFARVGTDPNNLNMVVRSSGEGNPHYARLANQLQPGQTYFFQIFDPSDRPLTPVLAFRTPVNGAVRGVPVQLAGNMTGEGYGRADRDRDRDRDRDQAADNQYGRDRDRDQYRSPGRDRDDYPNQDRDRDQYGNRDRDRDQYGSAQNGNDRVPQSDSNYGRGYGQNGYGQNANGGDVQIVGTPQVRLNGNGSAVVVWNTNVPASAVVHYGTDPNNLNQTAAAPWGGTNDTVTVNNLQPGVDY